MSALHIVVLAVQGVAELLPVSSSAHVPGARFCQQCGVSIGAKQCDSCGAEVAADARFSAGCSKAA